MYLLLSLTLSLSLKEREKHLHCNEMITRRSGLKHQGQIARVAYKNHCTITWYHTHTKTKHEYILKGR